MTLSPSSQPFKDEIDIKADLRSDTLDTRQDYEIKVTEKHARTQKLFVPECGIHMYMYCLTWLSMVTLYLEKSVMNQIKSRVFNNS